MNLEENFNQSLYRMIFINEMKDVNKILISWNSIEKLIDYGD